MSFDGEGSWGAAPVLVQTFAPGSHTIRTGILATYVDIVGGHVPAGALGPTIDLRIQVVAPTPTQGEIRLVGRPLRIGTRQVIAETTLHDGANPLPFAVAVTTFRNHLLGFDLPAPLAESTPMAEASFDEFLATTVQGPRSLAMSPAPRVANGMQATVQGGAQALLAEMTAEHAFGGGSPMTARDLDIRYLDRLRTGPLVATAEGSIGSDGVVRCRVRLTDGTEGHLVSFATLTMHPAN